MANQSHTIKALQLLFVNLAKPRQAVDKQGKFIDTFRYSAAAEVDKATFKELKKMKCLHDSRLKEYTPEDFKKIAKVDPVSEEDEVYVVQLTKNAIYKGKVVCDNDSKYRPRVILRDEDGGGTDITFKNNVANGSKGEIIFTTYTGSYGLNADLQLVNVTELVEYKGGGAPVLEGVELATAKDSIADLLKKSKDDSKDDSKGEEGKEEFNDDIPY